MTMCGTRTCRLRSARSGTLALRRSLVTPDLEKVLRRGPGCEPCAVRARFASPLSPAVLTTNVL